MPIFAHLEAPVPCPTCGEDLAIGGRIAFQWGYCHIPFSGTGPAYRLGEAIGWARGRGEQPPRWTYFRDGTGNIGDPSISDVLVRESEVLIRECPRCKHPLAGIAVTIRAGVICEVRAYLDGLPESDVSVITTDGGFIPRPDWDDAPMQIETEE